ncbi:hypothetical protein WA158_006114 [Blastocystis sp. Blastoise]
MSFSSLFSAELRQTLATYHQEHLLKYVDADQVTEEEAKKLLAQLNKIDFHRLQSIYDTTMEAAKAPQGEIKLEPLDNIANFEKMSENEADNYWKIGLEAALKGEVAVMLMAGGQGTRLRSDLPKGEYDIDLPSHKSLFQMQAERILRVQNLVSIQYQCPCVIPWYIMTSPMTDGPSKEFFEEHNYFGLSRDQVYWFQQGTLPCIGNDQKIIMSKKYEIATAPDGNGGMYMSMHLNGVIDDMKKRGVQYLQIYGVDNAVVKIPDLCFIGYSISINAQVGGMCVAKNYPEEKVGVICKKNGKYNIVEYSEIDPETAALRKPDGELVYSAGYICNSFYTVDFLDQKCSPKTLSRVYHIANKAIPYYDEATDSTVKPTSNNGIKLESFIFDVFPSADRVSAIIKGRCEFTPIKNAPGSKVDTPEIARDILLTSERNWLKAAGAIVQEDGIYEVSPLVSFKGEGLEVFKGITLASPCQIIRSRDNRKANECDVISEHIKHYVEDGCDFYIVN